MMRAFSISACLIGLSSLAGFALSIGHDKAFAKDPASAYAIEVTEMVVPASAPAAGGDLRRVIVPGAAVPVNLPDRMVPLMPPVTGDAFASTRSTAPGLYAPDVALRPVARGTGEATARRIVVRPTPLRIEPTFGTGDTVTYLRRDRPARSVTPSPQPRYLIGVYR